MAVKSLIILAPERSEKGKNFAKKSRIRPQKTVFCDLDRRRSKSVDDVNNLRA